MKNVLYQIYKLIIVLKPIDLGHPPFVFFHQSSIILCVNGCTEKTKSVQVKDKWRNLLYFLKESFFK